MLFRSGIAVVLFNLGKIAVHTGLRAVQRVGHILDRALQQEDTAVFKRSNDLHALVRRETVGGHAEADELAADRIACHRVDRVVEALGRWGTDPRVRPAAGRYGRR